MRLQKYDFFLNLLENLFFFFYKTGTIYCHILVGPNHTPSKPYM